MKNSEDFVIDVVIHLTEEWIIEMENYFNEIKKNETDDNG